MFLQQREINRRKAFEHLVEMKKQNVNTITVNKNVFSYTTKQGIKKNYIAINTLEEYLKSELCNNRLERVNEFLFVEQRNTIEVHSDFIR